MAGRLHYTPQSGDSRRAAKLAARQDPSLDVSASSVSASPSTQPYVARQRNVKPVISLGSVRYVTVRSLGTFAVPPVPFKLGQQVMGIYTDVLIAANKHIADGRTESQKEYFNLLSQLAALLHKHMRPIVSPKNFLWRVGLLRNPFVKCSEQELKDVASFFLQGRMRSSVQFSLETENSQSA